VTKAADTVAGVATKGKESRGGSSSDGYQFGDFSRGVLKQLGGIGKKQ